MTDSNEEQTWGFHLNEHVYSLPYHPCPKWANSREQQSWRQIGVVVWDAQVNRVTHLRGSQAVSILDNLRKSDTWKKDGLLVGEVAYQLTIPSDKKTKKKSEDQYETKPLQENGWCLTNTIQLSPDQTHQFLSFLLQRETILRKVAEEEEAERKRILARVYSMILSWETEREQSSASIKSKVVEEPKSAPTGAVSIPQGKYLTVSQVAKICGVQDRTVSMWLNKGLLKGLELPGLGKIVAEKDLEKHLEERQNRS
jgi:hypothetical protein